MSVSARSAAGLCGLAPHAANGVMALRLQSLTQLRAGGAARFACIQGAARSAPRRNGQGLANTPELAAAGCGNARRP